MPIHRRDRCTGLSSPFRHRSNKWTECQFEPRARDHSPGQVPLPGPGANVTRPGPMYSDPILLIIPPEGGVHWPRPGSLVQAKGQFRGLGANVWSPTTGMRANGPLLYGVICAAGNEATPAGQKVRYPFSAPKLTWPALFPGLPPARHRRRPGPLGPRAQPPHPTEGALFGAEGRVYVGQDEGFF